VLGVTLALAFLASSGVLGAWSGVHHYDNGKARLVAVDYSGCAAEMEQAIEAVSNSPKAWAYEAFCYILDSDPRAGLSAWYTAKSFDPNVSLDDAADQKVFNARLKAALTPPKAAAK
jgi:hypothetical protein